MEREQQSREVSEDKILAFDTRYTTNHIRMLKILLSRFEPEIQLRIAMYIKFMELKYVLSIFRHEHIILAPPLSNPPSYGKPETSFINSLIDELLPLCSPDEKNKFSHIKALFNTFDVFTQAYEMMDLMKDILPTDSSAQGTNDISPFDFLSGILNDDSNPILEFLADIMNPSSQ